LAKRIHSLLECFYTKDNNGQPDEGELDEEARIFSGQRMYIYIIGNFKDKTII
jgi:hypothetical protein